jgi:hypothetical protein
MSLGRPKENDHDGGKVDLEVDLGRPSSSMLRVFVSANLLDC